MNITNPAHIYLAEPIDRANGPNHLALAVSKLFDVGQIPNFCPATAWSNITPPYQPALQDVNDAALLTAACVLAVVPRDAASVGVPMEVERAINLGTSVVVLSDSAPEQFSAAWTQVAALDKVFWTMEPERAVEAAVSMSTHPPTRSAKNVAYFRTSGENSEAPRTGKPGDAGYDLVCSEDTMIAAGGFGSVPTDLAVQLPEGCWGFVHGRSSSWKQRLLVSTSIIDAGYRGVLFAEVHNLDKDAPYMVRQGDRVAQLVPMPLVPTLNWVEAMSLEESERGALGFGSTGR